MKAGTCKIFHFWYDAHMKKRRTRRRGIKLYIQETFKCLHSTFYSLNIRLASIYAYDLFYFISSSALWKFWEISREKATLQFKIWY